MEISYVAGAGIGLQNRYDALFIDESLDSLDEIFKASKKQTKKFKPKKQASGQGKQNSKEETPKKWKDSGEVAGTDAKSAIAGGEKVVKKTVTFVETGRSITEACARQIILDQYMKAKARSSGRKSGKYNLILPEEGEDLTPWRKIVPLHKKKFVNKEKADDHGYEVSEFPQRAGRVTHLPVDVSFGDSITRRQERRDSPSPPPAALSPDPEPVHQRPPRLAIHGEFPSL